MQLVAKVLHAFVDSILVLESRLQTSMQRTDSRRCSAELADDVAQMAVGLGLQLVEQHGVKLFCL